MKNGINNCHYRDCEAITDNLSKIEKKSAEIFGYCAASPKITESGRSMTEMLGVLAIVGVLSVGGIAGYSKAMNQIKINKTISQIMQAYANIQTMCRGNNCVEPGIEGPMISDVYPEELNCTGDYFSGWGYHAYHYCDLEIGAKFVMSVYDTLFLIGLYEMKDKETCIKLATYDWNFGGFNGISLGTDGGYFNYECIPEEESEYIRKCDHRITPTEAAYYCSNCSEDNGCGIEFSYYF